jgi:hypothetical protein
LSLGASRTNDTFLYLIENIPQLSQERNQFPIDEGPDVRQLLLDGQLAENAEEARHALG